MADAGSAAADRARRNLARSVVHARPQQAPAATGDHRNGRGGGGDTTDPDRLSVPAEVFHQGGADRHVREKNGLPGGVSERVEQDSIIFGGANRRGGEKERGENGQKHF